MVNYTDFIRKYGNEHWCCPNCGSINYSSTLVGYIYDENHPEDYEDRNHCKCYDCGWEGTRHELAPKPEIKDFKETLKQVAGIYYSEEVAEELLNIASKIYSR